MHEESQTSASIYLKQDVEEAPLALSADLRRRLSRTMERRAGSVKKRMSPIYRDCIKVFLKKNLFVLFTVAAVGLGE